MNVLENEINERYYAIVYTYKTIGIQKLADHYLKEEEIKELSRHFNGEMALLQTCNRIELYLYTKRPDEVKKLLEYLDHVHTRKISEDAVVLKGMDAVAHLFEVSAGIDSLSIGEYEILSQIKLALQNARRINITGKHLEVLLDRAIKVGRRVRLSTNISKGKVGVYSLAIELAKVKLGNLSERKICVIGAGEMAKKLTFMLNKEGAKNVTVLNRTVERAKEIAEKYGYAYGGLDLSVIGNFDVVFSAIYYPSSVEVNGSNLLFDLSSPPVFKGNNVITLEDLQQLSSKYLEQRKKDIEVAKEIIRNSLKEFVKDYENMVYDALVSELMGKIEEIRKEEVQRAAKKLNDNNKEEILNAMTKSMIKKIFSPLLMKIRLALENNDINYINFILELFNNGKLPDVKTEEVKEQQTN
ncbi:MAG: glutamyl-tRNA reductase [Candidatus Aramenus sulfurataquae]|jgi:glutamyl-tRNA reductase|uniref:Glutamyl-tRNA reductase n=2 Tax=Candidatus Aramenus sulfurataquae TaxID=1326980 RepID=W7KXH0_9CREN|nr:MAG: glutamyl-tRNA reductase [Candidatus Aramenus sulfurataquae]MCL7343247.1 glutamyl-tRNA reductase [Candidatus Aramenus sulfurataquae]